MAVPNTQLDLLSAGALSPEAVLERLGSGASGLTNAEAARRLADIGPNAITSRHVTALDILVRQLRNPLLILLLGAAGISAATGNTTDGGIIAAIVLLSVGLGFVNEYRSENAVAELHTHLRHETVLRREGVDAPVDVRELVPGDVIALRMGELVPADVRLLEVNGLECDEAALTGESMTAVKSVAPATSDSPVDLPSCAFMGTVVHQGSGRAVVVATGPRTAFGQIAASLAVQPAATAFQLGLRDFSRLLVRVGAALTVSIFIINISLRRPILEAVLFSLAIAIGITPQLLPAVVSLSLSTGSRSLARRKVLVKRLITIEDLGNIEVLFTDKTGTLTEGTITFDRSLGTDGAPSDEPLRLGLLCNEATLTPAGPVGGNALDVALWLAPTAGELAARADGPGAYHRSALIPFDHDRQRGSVVVTAPNGSSLLITKGAPESVFERCIDLPASAHALVADLFAVGARVVAVASRPFTEATPATGAGPTSADERDLHLEGFLTFIDRPKADAANSLARLAAIGIEVKVITGDNGVVATTVCTQLGLGVKGVLSGLELTTMSDDDLATAIPSTTVFARVSPDQKARIIRVARRTGVDVAFLGDGVNDAVALHAADVGISVDSATDIAKDAADIVLLDKDLGVLADGVMEGRRIFANTLKYVLMATSSNVGNMFSAAGASLFLTFLPMLPSQILLNNLLYDVGQLAIPTDLVDAEVLARPAAWDLAFVRRFMSIFGPISSIFDFLTFGVMLWVLHASHDEFRSGWFVESLATQTLVVFLIRTRRVPFIRSRPSTAMIVVPIACAVTGAVLPFTPLAHTLGFTALPVSFFLILVAMIVAYLALVEYAKGRFYASVAHPQRPPLNEAERHQRHQERRAGHLRHHPTVKQPTGQKV